MKAVIMAGGEGSRLRPMTCTLPKPMVKLCGRPVSEYILDLLSKHGCTDAVFTLRYRGSQIENHFESRRYKRVGLDFSYEEEPMGTAGCVKKAVEYGGFSGEDNFIVISGDAMCDFNLSAALSYHTKTGADATIITTQVDDPREYGCVISKNGLVTGFSEKPSYTGAVSDYVNTGVYVLSKKVLDLIPADTMWDFSKDVFPQMLQNGMKLASYEEKGYWCDIGDFTSYKRCQRDMLRGLVSCEFKRDVPQMEGVKIIAPCYIGSNVKIGAGTVVSAGSVIGDNVTVGRGCKLWESVICEGAFLSDRTKCNGGIICENAVMEQGSAVYEDAVLGSGSILGRNSSLEPKVKVWDNKTVPKETMQREDIKYGGASSASLDEKGISGETNCDITPAFMTKLGSGAAAVFGDRTVVSCGCGNAASVLKACFCAGFSGAGGKVIDCGVSSLPALVHLSRVMNASGLVNIEVSSQSKITMLNKAGLPLTRVQERKLEAALNRGDYRNAEWDGFGEIKAFKNASLLYSGALENASDFSCRYRVSVNCTNPLISAAAEAPFKKIGNPSGEPLTVNISRDGTKAELYVSENEKADYTKLVTIVGYDLMKKGFDLAVPLEFPSSAEEAARLSGQRVLRFYRCSNDNGDKAARELAASQPFLFDGLMLALNALEIISASYVTLGKYLEGLPSLETENRFLHIHCPPQRILSKLADKSDGVGEGIFLGEEGNRVLLRSNRQGNGLFLFAEGYSQETAKALCDSVEMKVRELLEK